MQSIPLELEDNGTVGMLVPNSKEVNKILLLKGDQHGCRPHHCKSRIVKEHCTYIFSQGRFVGVHRNQYFKIRPEPDLTGTGKEIRPELPAGIGT